MSKTPEGQILASIMEYLAVRGVLCFRMNTGAFKADNRFIRFGTKGMADILASPRLDFDGKDVPNFLWLECKTAKARRGKERKAALREALKVSPLSCPQIPQRDVEDATYSR